MSLQKANEIYRWVLSQARGWQTTFRRGPAFLSEQEKQKQDRHGKNLDAVRLLISSQKTSLISVRLSINFDGGSFKILCLHFSGAVTAKYASKNVFS